MSNHSRTTIVAVGVALTVVVACLAGIWGEYQVSQSRVPAPSELTVVTGNLESCALESSAILGPMRLLHGAWGGPSTYILTLHGVDAQFRTQAFDCAVGVGDAGNMATVPGAIMVTAQKNPIESVPGGAPLYNAYGLTVNGVVMRTPAADLADHRRAHDWIAPINIAGLLLLAFLLPGLIVGALRGHLWTDDESALAPRNSKNPSASSESPARE